MTTRNLCKSNRQDLRKQGWEVLLLDSLKSELENPSEPTTEGSFIANLTFEIQGCMLVFHENLFMHAMKNSMKKNNV